jgi:hypothetical protein
MENSTMTASVALPILDVSPKVEDHRKSSKSTVVTDAELKQWHPLIKKLINEQILRFWAKGNTTDTMDWDASVGRLGMSINDLMQIGQIYAWQQLRWIKENHDPEREHSASVLTLMYTFLKNKFQSLCRIHTNAKHGGGIVNMDDHRAQFEAFITAVDSESSMSLSECDSLLQSTFCVVNVEVQKIVKAGLYTAGGFRPRFKTAADVADHVRAKIKRLEVVHHVSLDSYKDDDQNPGNRGRKSFEAVEYVTPETYLIAKQYMEKEMETKSVNEVVTATVKRRNTRSSNRRIFLLAKEKGLPTAQGELAAFLGKTPSAFSNILKGEKTNGDATFQKRVQDVFGESIETLRQPVVSTDKPTV